MNCKTCGEFFQPTSEEERMMAGKQIEEICMNCAMKKADAVKVDWKPEPLRIEEGRYDGTKLYRAEKFDKDGKLLCFLARPQRPLKARHRSLRKPRKGIIHVGIIGGDDGNRAASEPRVVVHTNIETFKKLRKPFWVTKVPGFWDPQTGVSRIEVPCNDVVEIVESKQEKRVVLKDGSSIRLLYK